MYQSTEVDPSVLEKLPEPTGYRLLIALLEVSEKTEGGVYMPDSLKSAEEVASMLGYVLKVGPEAYSDKSRFPTGPYCKAGDFVVFRPYSGTRFKIENKEFRLINDDTVEGTVADPRWFKRV